MCTIFRWKFTDVSGEFPAAIIRTMITMRNTPEESHFHNLRHENTKTPSFILSSELLADLSSPHVLIIRNGRDSWSVKLPVSLSLRADDWVNLCVCCWRYICNELHVCGDQTLSLPSQAGRQRFVNFWTARLGILFVFYGDFIIWVQLETWASGNHIITVFTTFLRNTASSLYSQILSRSL
jgi:hypothetical protein